jgi:hypothetical protein
MSLYDDKAWAMKMSDERARAVDEDQHITYFFLNDYPEICRYMRAIG